MTDIVHKLAECAAQLTAPGMPFELSDCEFDGTVYKAYKQAPRTMKELMDAARVHGDRSFLVFEDEDWSFTRFFACVDAVGHQLVHRYGVKKGDRIAIAMRNFPEWMAAYTAVVSLGAIVVPLNSWGQRAELEYGLTDSGASVVFCDQRRYDFIADDLDALGIKAVVVRGERAPGAYTETHAKTLAETWETFIAGGLGKPLPAFDCDPEDPVMIMYTSGTTGHPKGALSCHRNITQAIVNFEFHAACSAMANPEIMAKMFSAGAEPSSLLAVPLFHVSGCYAQFLLSLRGGRRIVMMYKWDAATALKLIEQYRITAFSGVPSMVIDMLEHPDFDRRNTSSLTALGGGGAACPPKFTRLAYEKIDSAYVGSGYGMTESNAIASSFTGAAHRYKPTSSGTLSPIVEFKTVDENGTELPRGESGEIWLKSPTIIQAYWNNPAATASAFHDHWYATGDIGYIDDEDFVFLVDRAKDMVIRGGENIYSAEIEACLSEHPAVHEVAAFGVPHDTLGEELAVAVTRKADAQVSEQDLQHFVGARLAGFKVPSHVWFRSEALPRNAAGKVVKKAIREEYLGLRAAP